MSLLQNECITNLHKVKYKNQSMCKTIGSKVKSKIMYRLEWIGYSFQEINRVKNRILSLNLYLCWPKN